MGPAVLGPSPNAGTPGMLYATPSRVRRVELVCRLDLVLNTSHHVNANFPNSKHNSKLETLLVAFQIRDAQLRVSSLQ